MRSTDVTTPLDAIVYPDSDGEPIGENTIQYDWIVKLKGSIDHLFANDPQVFVAGDLFWYPVEGDNVTRTAPDVLVAFGRPKGDRSSYMQWREEGISPQVVIEVQSPGNRAGELQRKLEFYDRFGVDEYYLLDPNTGRLKGWLRRRDQLEPLAEMQGWTSPRLGIRFESEGGELQVYDPSGQPLGTYHEQAQRADNAEQELEKLRAFLRSQGIEPPA